MDNKTLFAIFTCNEWKMRDSMNLVAIADEEGLGKVYMDIMKKMIFPKKISKHTPQQKS